jgi:hypothetical protein
MTEHAEHHFTVTPPQDHEAVRLTETDRQLWEAIKAEVPPLR